MKYFLSGLIIFFSLVILVNVLVIVYSGTPIAVPHIPREPVTLGTGKPITYVILGDSTAVGQGGDYERGIAVQTATFLSGRGFKVTYHNLAISGARVKNVLEEQAGQAIKLKPDIVLLAVGANDVTHLTQLRHVRKDTHALIDMLQAANPAIRIVMTGSPEMGAVPRFIQPTRLFAERRTAAVNRVFDEMAREKKVIRAPIAEETGPLFKMQPALFAQDKFHPSNAGYATWVPILYHELSTIITL